MLAFAWAWHGGSDALPEGAASRLAASLCAGIGGTAAARSDGACHFAFRPLLNDPAAIRRWQPARLEGERFVVFHGHFDNAGEIAGELGCDPTDLARLYAQAVARWGDAAELRIIGEYCAIIGDPGNGLLRLSRSPLRAPPLVYSAQPGFAAAASVPRALFAMGVPQRLNEARVADSALLHFTDEESGWFHDVTRVPVGAVVELRPGQARVLRRTYDMTSLPDVRYRRDEDYLERASELFDAAVRASLAGSRRPGTTLSSGLDSSQVTVRALRALGPGARLPTFTFHPEAGWDGITESWGLGNERPWVEEFAAMHPGLEPHFTDNAGYANDHRWPEMFHLMGGATSGACNMYVMHGVWASARDAGCDRLLLAEWGNFTFSDKGDWGFVEYLLKGKWRSLWQALRDHPNDVRPMWRRIAALTLMPLLPLPIWLKIKGWMHPDDLNDLDLITPLSMDYRESSGANARLRKSGFRFDRYQPHNRRHAQRMLFANGECETAEIYQCFEQLYGVGQRDPTAWRPFFEFCYGLPVHMFLRDGELRWLAKELARGIMPERQRANRLNGRWDSDWHLRLSRKRQEYMEELDRMEDDPRLARMIDVTRLRALLIAMPEKTIVDRQKVLPLEMALPRAVQVARFIRYVEGSNR